MSRLGKQPVKLPNGVKAQVNGQQVQIEGPRGKLSGEVVSAIGVELKDGALILTPNFSGDKRARKQVQSNFGTAHSLLKNMVLGVSQGFKRSLEMNGVGFTATLKGQQLVLSVGFSHEVKVEVPKSVKVTVTKNVIDMESNEKEVLGTLAAYIRKVQPPEPYLGKGIKYSDETVRRKAGKTGKKA